VPPLITWRTAAPLMGEFGISRVTEITRLDRLGLPVCVSVRPRGATLRVHAGKGLRPLEARVGALMEALEFAVADPARALRRAPRLMSVRAFLEQFAGQHGMVDFAPTLDVPIALEQQMPVVRCEQIGSRRATWMPAELVFVPYVPDRGASFFGWTSNGLASGNTLDEATLHGLLEVLERDALAMNYACERSRWVEPETLPEPFRSEIRRWHALGMQLALREVPNEHGLPCFMATLFEPGSASVNLAGGAGLHLSRETALARAICEAAQSRVGCIHGGREDLVGFYAKYTGMQPARRRRAEQQLVRQLFDRRRSVAFDQVQQPAANSGLPIARVLNRLLQHLAARGFPSVFRHRFAQSGLNGLRVVKVIVPGCELADHATRRFGRRLFKRLTSHG
jgi:ribosomal protein S12 methylthiotransferase accessory factor